MKKPMISAFLILVFASACYLQTIPLHVLNSTTIPSQNGAALSPQNSTTTVNLDGNPSLIQISNFKGPSQINWISNDSFRYIKSIKIDGNCVITQYQTATIKNITGAFDIGNNEEYQEQNCSLNQIYPVIFSPKHDLAIIQTSTTTPTAPIQMDKKEKMNEAGYNQINIFSTTTDELTPLVSTPLNYLVEWFPDEKKILLTGLDIGDYAGNGLSVVNLETREVKTILDDYKLSEYSLGVLISPDGQNLLASGKVISLNGSSPVSICGSDEDPFAQTWSTDGQYAYAFCHNANSDYWGNLRKINMKTLLVESDLLVTNEVIKPIQISVSPNQKWLVFQWGNSLVKNTEASGLWLVELK